MNRQIHFLNHCLNSKTLNTQSYIVKSWKDFRCEFLRCSFFIFTCWKFMVQADRCATTWAGSTYTTNCLHEQHVIRFFTAGYSEWSFVQRLKSNRILVSPAKDCNNFNAVRNAYTQSVQGRGLSLAHCRRYRRSNWCKWAIVCSVWLARP